MQAQDMDQKPELAHDKNWVCSNRKPQFYFAYLKTLVLWLFKPWFYVCSNLKGFSRNFFIQGVFSFLVTLFLFNSSINSQRLYFFSLQIQSSYLLWKEKWLHNVIFFFFFIFSSCSWVSLVSYWILMNKIHKDKV